MERISSTIALTKDKARNRQIRVLIRMIEKLESINQNLSVLLNDKAPIKWSTYKQGFQLTQIDDESGRESRFLFRRNLGLKWLELYLVPWQNLITDRLHLVKEIDELAVKFSVFLPLFWPTAGIDAQDVAPLFYDHPRFFEGIMRAKTRNEIDWYSAEIQRIYKGVFSNPFTMSRRD